MRNELHWEFIFLLSCVRRLSMFRIVNIVQEEFEDTKGVIRIRKDRQTDRQTDRQHNGQKKNNKKTIYKTLHRKPKAEQHEHH